MKRVRCRSGFTLVELLIVIIVIAILGGIAIPKMRDSRQASQEASVRQQLKLLRNAVEQFEADTSRYPKALSDLSATTAPATGYNGGGLERSISPSSWRGPYLAGAAVPSFLNGWISYAPEDKGKIWCPRAGSDLRGMPYSSY
ncbi:MAG TPA: prepilin-type N-terminal cleavage/methylation domain-containing protein [Fimbriimonadaceae bacterium]|nr:prepilin-type N-terminal cleavage/methylation domain-containing protein [Fimbriimonadaceae bacterium]